MNNILNKKNYVILSLPCLVFVLAISVLIWHGSQKKIIPNNSQKAIANQEILSNKANIKTLDTSILAITNEINNLNSSLVDQSIYTKVLGITDAPRSHVSRNGDDGISTMPSNTAPSEMHNNQPSHNPVPTINNVQPTHSESHGDSNGKLNTPPNNNGVEPTHPNNPPSIRPSKTNNDDHDRLPSASVSDKPNHETNHEPNHVKENELTDQTELENEAHPSDVLTSSPSVNKNISMRDQLNLEINRRISKLKDLKNKISKSNSLTDEQKQLLFANLDQQIQSAQQSKNELGSSNDKNLGSLQQKIEINHVQFTNVLPKAQSFVVEDRINDAADRLILAHDFINSEVNNSSIDQSTKSQLKLKLDDINTLANTIKNLSSQAKLLSEKLSSSTDIKNDIKPIQQLVSEAIADLQQDKNYINSIINTISVDEAAI